MREAGSSGSRSQPSTSVMKMTFSARIAAATWAAASSALMLYERPSASVPTDEITGT